MRDYCLQIVKNAKSLEEELKKFGVRLVSGGTDNHLLLIDVTGFGLTGKEAEALLEEVNITTNKNTIPNDKQSPFVTSGIRIGTPAMTTRGMKEEEMRKIADLIFKTLKREEPSRIKEEVSELTKKFPLYL